MEALTNGISPEERVAVFRAARLAAEVDVKDERERQHLRRLLHTPRSSPQAGSGSPEFTAVVCGLRSPAAGRLAYEVAVGACAADGLRTDAETRFLARLGAALGLSQPEIVTVAATADELSTAPLAALSSPVGPAVNRAPPGVAGLDRAVLTAAVTNAAFALLPEPAVAMVIVPLQLKLVHRVGRSHGKEYSRAQSRELLLAMGAGLAAQFVAHVGRRLLGASRSQASDAVNSAGANGGADDAPHFAFATTYAIGETVRRAGAGDVRADAKALGGMFAEALVTGRTLYARCAKAVEDQARDLDVRRLLQFVRSQ